MDRKTKSEFLKLRGKCYATGTKAAKVDRVKSIKQMLEDAKYDKQDKLGLKREMENDYFVRLTKCCEATNKQNVKSNPNPATPLPSQVEELDTLYRTKKKFNYIV